MLMMLIYWAEANILVTRTTEAFLIVSKESGLEENTDKTKYMVVSQYQNAEQSHNTYKE
jgi:hypothetical protein